MENENKFENFDEINTSADNGDNEPLSIEEVLEMYKGGEENKSEATEEESPKKKKHILLWVVLGLLALIAAICAWVYFSYTSDYQGGKKNGEYITVVIPQGSNVSDIADILEDEKVINSALFFRFYSKMSATETLYRYGTFKIEKGSGYEEIAEVLISGGEQAKSVTVTIPEGTCLYDYVKNVNGKDVTVPGIGSLLEKAGVCTKEDFYAALDEVELEGRLLSSVDKENTYYPLEGYLFPDTYDFFCYDSKECAKLAIDKMLKHTEEIITDEMIENARKMGYSIHEMLTLASIVQLESGINTDEMANVSAVFHNRLNNPSSFAHLGSSPTIYYDKTMNGDGRYDTQNTAIGLPPGPVCSPGAAAIKAAFLPTENFKYTYFVTDSDGKFYYNTSAAGHSSTIKKLQASGKWIYELY